MSKTFCPVPWISVNTRSNGDLRICCQSDSSPSKGSITKEDGTIYNIATDGITSFRNSNIMKSIRIKLLNDQNPEQCVRCVNEEQSGVLSRRMYDNEMWANKFNASTVAPYTSADGTIDENNIPLQYADLRFGNLCNLKCRMCGPTDSSAWYDEFLTVLGQDTFKDATGKEYKLVKEGTNKAKLEVDNYNWHSSPHFWENLEKQIPNLKHIFIIGGEPLLIEQYYDFLEKCIALGYANNMTIEIMTNLTVVPAKVWELWDHFKKIIICASIDAVGKLNDYIRYPGKWSQIESNLIKLTEAEGNFKIIITPTIQVYNLTHLPDLLLWKITNFNKVTMTLHPLHSPVYLNIKTFTKDSKKIIQQLFNEYKITYKNKMSIADYSYFSSELDSYINYMNSGDTSAHLQTLKHISSTIDIARNQSLLSVNPLTYKLIYG